jgi:hypothetical protein
MSGPTKTIDFIIDAFNTEITLEASGNLLSALVTMDASCVADLYVDASLARLAFQFQTDASDVVNVSDTDIKYFVDREQFWNYDSLHSFSINPADAVVDYVDTPVKIMDSSAVPEKNMVCHDFVRYLAQKLFNTPYGVDLFNNELDLLNDIRLKAERVWNTIDNQLVKYNVDSIAPLGAIINGVTYEDQVTSAGTYSGLKYYTNAHSGNISKKILEQMAHHNPARLRNIEDTSNVQPIPFIGGDTISLKLTINPASGQENLTGVPAFGARTFRIRFNLVEDYKSLHTLEQERAGDENELHKTFTMVSF